MKKEKIILVLNGSLPKKNNLFIFLKKYNKVFCADGAANKVIDSDIKPNLILGDLDSLSDKYSKKYNKQLIKLPDQNFNDFQKILSWLKENKYQTIDIIGLNGNRLDHTIGNFHIVMQQLKNFNFTIFTSTGILYTIEKNRMFENCINKYFSIFSPSKNNKINTYGLKYEFKNKTLKDIQEGTLNIANKNKVTIKTQQKILVFISIETEK